MKNIKKLYFYLIVVGLFGHVANSNAQAAGAGADYNKKDREKAARIAEDQRLQKIDKPVRPDPLGNALIGGGVTSLIRGGAAGIGSVVTGTVVGQGANKVRDKKK